MISYEYHKEDEDHGERIGHVYAIFIFTALSGIESTKVHVVQIDGVSKSKEKNPFPSFRNHNIEHIQNAKILNETFSPPYHEAYNADSSIYQNVIIKI